MQRIRLAALGGLDEDGKNMYLIEIDDDIFVVEAGLKYPNESEQLGVEYIIPDFSYLIQNKDRIRGVFLSHGHEDVMLGLCHLLKEIDVDVYGTALTIKILEAELQRRQIHSCRVHIINRMDEFKVHGHKINSFPISMSVPDGCGYAFDTEYGPIVYTSEFIFEFDYSNKYYGMSISALTAIGARNPLALLAESSASDRKGYTTPRYRITEYLERFLDNNDDRVIISLYKQNLYRIMEIVNAAVKYGRKVFFYDEDHINLLKTVQALGYYQIPKNVIIDKKDFNNSIVDCIVVVSANGSKVFKIMNKIAVGEDDVVELRPKDTVIIASPVVPGTEKVASTMENDLYKADVRISKVNAKELLNMHASIEDLKMMLYMIKPKYYLPIMGQYSSLVSNAEVATKMGYTPDKIVILDNGQFATFENGKLVSTRDTIELNDTLIDGSDRTDVSGMVLKDRESLSTDGVIVVGVVLNYDTKEVFGGPDVQSRGVIYLKDADYILTEVGNILLNCISTAVAEKRYENMTTRIEAREQISKYILKETGKKPMILPAIVEIRVGDE